MSRRRGRPDPPKVRPFDVDGVRTVAVGTVLWAVAFVVLALNRDALDEQDMGWLLWTCLAGVGLGLLGLEYTRKRRDTIARARLHEEADRPDEALVSPAGEVVELEVAEDGVELQPAEDSVELEPVDAVDVEQAEAGGRPEMTSVDAGPWPPEPAPTGWEREPAAREPEPRPESTVTEPAEPDLLDLGPRVAAPSNRRARRAASTFDDSVDDLDEPLLPMAIGDIDAVPGRPAGRRARRSPQDDDDESSDDGTDYRGRRSRRP